LWCLERSKAFRIRWWLNEIRKISGGSVFAPVLEGNAIVLKFAGIINRPGGGIIHFIKAKSVQRLLDQSV